MIKVRHSISDQRKNFDYHIQKSKELTYEKVDSNSVNLFWNQIYYSDAMGGIRKPEVIYNVIAVDDPRIRLDSIC